MLRKTLYILICTLLFACSSADGLKKTVITKQNVREVVSKINKGDLLNKDEINWYMLGQTLINMKKSEGTIGKTVGEIIDAGKAASAPQPQK